MKTDFYRLNESEGTMRKISQVVPGTPIWARVCNILGAVWVVGFLAGCAGPQLAESDTSAVSKRALARWEALIAGDLEKAYGFFSAGSKQTTSYAAYKGIVKPGMWRSAEVKEVKCEEKVCTVRMSIVYDHRMMKNVRTDLTETWLLEEGGAGYVFR